MPPRNQQQQIDSAHEHIMVVVGRLLEITEATSEGIHKLSEETKQNTSAAQLLQQSVAALQVTVQELDRITRTGNGESLITRMRLSAEESSRIRQDQLGLTTQVGDNRQRIEDIERAQATAAGGNRRLTDVLQWFGWAVATAIALYAALKGK